MNDEVVMRYPAPAKTRKVLAGREVFRRKDGKQVSRPIYIYTTRALLPTFAGTRSRDITLPFEESASIEVSPPSSEVAA